MTTREIEFLALGVLVGVLVVVIDDWWRARRRTRVPLRAVKPGAEP